MRLFAAALLAVLLPACGDDKPKPGSEQALENGRVANPDDWDAVWIGNCTAAKVGPRVLQTAAHCVRSGETRTVTIAGVQHRVTFTNHVAYSEAQFYVEVQRALEGAEPVNATADWALGVSDKDMPGQYSPLLLTPGKVAVGDTVTLSGFGCQVWGGRLDGQFRVGTARVTRIPSGGSNYDVVTQGGAALCSGDSGGPSFVTVDGVRHVLAPNSRRSLSGLTSYIPPWYNKIAADWVLAFAKAKNLVLCGVGASDSRCRGFKQPEPPPSPTPTPPGPTPEPTPPPPAPSVSSCRGAMLRLEAKLFNKPFGDATPELEYLKACSAAPKPLPEIAVAP